MNLNLVAQIRAKSQQKDKAKKEERIVCLNSIMQAMVPFFEFSLSAADFKSMYATDFAKLSDEKMTSTLRGLGELATEVRKDLKDRKTFVQQFSQVDRIKLKTIFIKHGSSK